MGSSTIRKAIGAVKDQTSISLAKVAGNVAPELEVLVVKATTHDDEPADEKYIREISNMISYSDGYVYACIFAISKRLKKTRNWIVALKALMLVHRLLSDAHAVFGQELMVASRRGTRVLNMSGFRDEAHSNSWDHSGFVRAYALYLDQKLEFMAYERKLSTVGDEKKRYSDVYYGDLRDKSGYGMDRRTRSYGDMNEAHKQINEATWVRALDPESILERLNHLLLLLERFLASRPTGAAQNTRMVLVALYLVVKDSFGVYAHIAEVLNNLLELFPEMDYSCCVKAFDAYVNAAKTIDELVMFYNWCKDAGIARSSEFPEVQKISAELLGMLEGLLRDQGLRLNRTSETREETFSEIIEEKELNLNEIKALPPPEYNYYPPAAPQHQDKLQNQVITEDLMNLKDDEISADQQDNKLALALFSTAPSSSEWVEFPTEDAPEMTSAWLHSAAKVGKTDWELELVGSASHLPKQKAELGGGFDPLLLNGMYDQGTVSQYMNNSQLTRGSASSVALPMIGKMSTQVLALPAPDGTIQPVGQQDPFAASLSVPPPSYVQIADMEKKQQLLMQEQQLWQQYANNGMQGQLGLSPVAGALQILPPHGGP